MESQSSCGTGLASLPTLPDDSPTLPMPPSAALLLREHHGLFQHSGDGVVVYPAGEDHRATDPQGEQPDSWSHPHNSEPAEWPTTNRGQPDERLKPRRAEPSQSPATRAKPCARLIPVLAQPEG